MSEKNYHKTRNHPLSRSSRMDRPVIWSTGVVAEKLVAVIASKIAFERLSKSDDEIVAAIV